MENTKPDTASMQEIEWELQGLLSPDFRGVAPTKEYRAAFLFGRINKEFEDVQRNVKVLGCLTFKAWMDKFRRTRQYISIRAIFYYVKIGRYLLPVITEEQYNALGMEKAKILADLAKPGKLDDALLKASFGYSRQKLGQLAAPILGRVASWTQESRLNGVRGFCGPGE
jgi:hypothetical protein